MLILNPRRAILACVVGISVQFVVAGVGGIFLGITVAGSRFRMLNQIAVFGFFVAVIAAGILAALYAYTGARSHDGECRCRKCGYILRGLSEPRCPECGTMIDSHTQNSGLA